MTEDLYNMNAIRTRRHFIKLAAVAGTAISTRHLFAEKSNKPLNFSSLAALDLLGRTKFVTLSSADIR